MTLSAEFRFLMLAVRAAMPGGAPPRVDVDLVDWSEFVQLVDRHRVAGLVCAGLTRLAVAPPCKEALTERADHAARRELYTAFEASRLTSTFAAVGISALTLKGPALAARAFGRLGLRYNHDIDFLVSESEVSRAAEALENAGYERITPSRGASAAELVSWVRVHKDMQFARSGQGIIVELHWRLFDNPTTMPFDATRCAPAKIDIAPGHRLLTLPPDVEFVYLCVHGAEHAWSRVKWLADLAGIISHKSSAELEELFAFAREAGLERPVASALSLCARLVGTNVPQAILQRAESDWRVRHLVSVALRSMCDCGAAEIEDIRFATTRKNISHYVLKDGFRYWRHELVYDLTDLSRMQVPAGLKYVAPFLRPVWWVGRTLRALSRGNA